MARKIVKPTPAEQVIIDRRLRRKYPQMYKSNWVTDLKKKVKKEKEKGGFKTTRTKQIEKDLRGAGLTEKEIALLRGKK